jgi:CRISPR-associated exonuclease Cas4
LPSLHGLCDIIGWFDFGGNLLDREDCLMDLFALSLPLGVVLVVLSLLFIWQAARKQRSAGMPGGRIIYSDTRDWGEVEAPLYHPLLEITGKPDYIIRKGKQVIPVEVKSGRTPDAPYDSHIFQVAAYCVLVEREYGIRPPYGIIHYINRTYAVDFTRELENSLVDVLIDMRACERKREVKRSHEETARCRGCGFRDVCEESL